jgi:integrase
MAALQRTDIAGNYIFVTTQKTNDRLPIDLNKYSKAILEKYKDQKFPNGLALPVITNQRMNEYLKDLCELCGLNTPITRVVVRGGQRVQEVQPKFNLIGTHAGRRTFICFALSSGIPPQVVMKWTGHSDYKAMKPYIDIAEKTKAEAMKQLEKALFE